MKLFPFPGLNRGLSVLYYLCFAVVLVVLILIVKGVPKTAESFMNYFVTAGVCILINVALGTYAMMKNKRPKR